MKITVKKLVPEAILPKRATEGSACFDLHALLNEGEEAYVLWPGEGLVFRTGLAFEIPSNHVMLIFSRSGHGFNYAIRLANCVGVIDSDYRGEVKIKLTNDKQDGFEPFQVKNGDRIAQALILPFCDISLEEAHSLSVTERGDGGFGHTGA